MNIRKITSMTMFLSGIILVVNSVVLYVVPQGRVSYWADWRFLGLTKSDWGAQHTTVGFLFLAAGILHIFYNWKLIVAYMKNKAREFRLFTGSFNVALVFTLFFVVGTYFNVPPMSTIMNISEYFKDGASAKYGEPPYGHAESSSLKMFTSKEKLDLHKSIELLKSAGIEVESEKDIIKDLAKKAGKSPQQIYLIIKPAIQKSNPKAATDLNSSAGPGSFLEGSKSGMGKRTIAELCKEYNLDLDLMLRRLNEKGIVTDGKQKLKLLAEKADSSPMAIYEAMREIVGEQITK